MKRLELVGILYRELQYKIIKNNPKISDKDDLKKRLKKATNIKRKLATQFLFFSIFGFSLASSVFFADDKTVISSILVTLAVIPFVFAIYMTTIQTSYIDSLGVFEPLKSLPLDVGPYQLTALLSIDFLPMFSFGLPTIGYLLIYYPASGVLSLIWFSTGILLGHTLGLVIYNTLGLKVEEGGKRLRFVKNLIKILGFLAFMSMFFMITYLQDYIISQSQIFLRYSIVYPFSIASVFEPLRNSVTLLVHLSLLIPIYFYYSKIVWKNVMGVKTVSTQKADLTYTINPENAVISLMKKDLKIIFRKSAMIAGLLVPLYVLIPQIFIAIQSGNLSTDRTTIFLFIIGLLTVASSDAILKVDGKGINSLKTLPLTKWNFMLSKALSMSVTTIIMGLALIGLGTYFHLKSLILLPYAFLLPAIASLFTMFYLFRYKGNEIGTPDINFYKLFPLLLMTAGLFGVVAVPILLMQGWIRYLTSYAVAGTMVFFLYHRLRG